MSNENQDEALDYVAEQVGLTPRYLVYMTLAGVLAGVGLLSNSVPILVGSMVIAPALPPVALVAFALVHRKPSLVFRGLGVGVFGLLCAAGAAFLIAWLMRATDVIPAGTELLDKPMLEERVRPGWWSLAAAVAGGIVGTVALSEKKTDSLIGTVAALALVPAAAAAAVAALAADLHRTLGGLLLLGMNFGLVIAMGILTLLVLRRELAATPIAAAVLITAGVVLLLALARAVGVATGEPTSIPTTSSRTAIEQSEPLGK